MKNGISTVVFWFSIEAYALITGELVSGKWTEYKIASIPFRKCNFQTISDAFLWPLYTTNWPMTTNDFVHS